MSNDNDVDMCLFFTMKRKVKSAIAIDKEATL